jgi:hypothetical protein
MITFFMTTEKFCNFLEREMLGKTGQKEHFYRTQWVLEA